MRVRRALISLVLVVTAGLSGCGDDDGSDETGSDEPSSDTAGSGDTRNACEVLTAAEVTEAVGAPVKEGVRSSGPASTGGRFSSCVWQSDDPASPADSATLTIYPNTAAADSAREDGSQDVPGIGDGAFTAAFSSIWVYVGEESFFAQRYTVDDSEGNGALAEALAEAAAASF